MTDSFIQLPTDGAGKKLDSEQLTVNAETVQRERVQLAGTTDVAIAAVTNTDPIAGAYALALRLVGPVSVQTSHGTSATVAAGAEVDIDSTQITASATGKLMQVIVSSSVSIRVQLKTVLNAAESAVLLTGFSGTDLKCELIPVSKEAFTVAHDVTAGLDAFRVTIKNLDTTAAADVYATFIWDEV